MNRSRYYPSRGVHGEVVYRIGRRIMSGAWKSGDVIPESELLAKLNVSRTVLREAVKVLAAKGLIESKQGTGTRVRPRDQWSLLDPDVLAWLNEGELDEPLTRNLAEIRRVIEPAAAHMAAERASEEEIRSLEGYYELMESTVDDHRMFVDADMRWHFCILAACHNELLEQMNVAIGEALKKSRTITIELQSSEPSLPLHKAVVEAIRKRDGKGARFAMEKLMDFVENDIDRFFEKASTEIADVSSHL